MGKILGAFLGYLAFGFWGALLGLLIGSHFDRRSGGLLKPLSMAEQQRIQETFFDTVFSLLGKLAKADGRISEAEIFHTEQLMNSMGLTAEHRREAIARFKEGAAAEFSVDTAMQRFIATCGRHNNLKRMLLNYLISMVQADSGLTGGEEQVLRRVAEYLGYSSLIFDQLIAMLQAQSRFRGYGQGQAGPQRAATENELATAYTALGVNSSSTDAEIKKAYRRLMSENHPDKLMGQGVPEDMVKLATERTQEIQTAYDIIKQARNIS